MTSVVGRRRIGQGDVAAVRTVVYRAGVVRTDDTADAGHLQFVGADGRPVGTSRDLRPAVRLPRDAADAEVTRACGIGLHEFHLGFVRAIPDRRRIASCFFAIHGPKNTTFTSDPYIFLIYLPWATIGDTTGAIYFAQSG